MAEFVLWLGLDPDEAGRLLDIADPLSERLETPLIGVDGVQLVEDIHYAPDDRSAMVPIIVADDVDLDDTASISESLQAAVRGGLSGAPVFCEVFMAAPSGDPCPTCGRVNGHDWSKHTTSANYAGGLTRL